MPAPPPNVRTAADVTEAFLARLDGSAFDAPLRIAGELVERSDDWARSVTSGHAPLIVRLDPPDRGDAWNLAVFAPGRARAHWFPSSTPSSTAARTGARSKTR